MQQLFETILSTSVETSITPGAFLLCVLVSLAAGLVLTLMSMWRTETSRSFLVTAAVLPAAVCSVIMMVNGNIGAGVAVAGAFGLVRFRSASGTAREIGAIFASMAIGLMTGMGYLAYALLFALVIGGIMMLYTATNFGAAMEKKPVKEIHISIPEDLDYNGVFEPVLTKYCTKCRLLQVKTTHMGSLFKLKYEIELKDEAQEKAMIDELRMRNGNLEIMVAFRCDTKSSDL